MKFNSDDDLPLNKTVEIDKIVIIIRSVFLEGKEYSPEVFLDE